MYKPKIFISYSHLDNKWMDIVEAQLSVSNSLNIWVDTKIGLGNNWLDEIKKAMEESDVAILLISANFLKSNFIKEEEVPELLIRKEISGLKIIPLMVADCDWEGVAWINDNKYQGYPENFVPLEQFSDAGKNTTLKNLSKDLREMFSISDCTGYTCTDDIIMEDELILSSVETQKIISLLEQEDINFLKKLTYQYMPYTKSLTLPNSVKGIIKELLEIGFFSDHKIPLLCLLNDLYERFQDKNFLNYINYIKKVKFYNFKNAECKRNKKVVELSIFINITPLEGKQGYKIQTWEHTPYYEKQILKDIDTKEVIFETDINYQSNQIALSNYLDALFEYTRDLEDIYDTNDIYIEIVLPNNMLVNFYNTQTELFLKAWKNSDGYTILSEYKCLLRMQSRFEKPDKRLQTKWKNLDIYNGIETLLSHPSKKITCSSYNCELSNAYNVAFINNRVDNPENILKDIKHYGIPIALLPLSDSCVIKAHEKIKVKKCKNHVCSYMMDEHHCHKSDILFVYDDPQRVPKHCKTKNKYRY